MSGRGLTACNHGEASLTSGPGYGFSGAMCHKCGAFARFEAAAAREALERLGAFAEDVARQWGYVSGGAISAGGLSVLEDAFEILGWDDPRPLEEGDPALCDEPGCGVASSSGWPSPSGYRHTCHWHSDLHAQLRCNWPADSDHWAARASDGGR